MEKKDIGKLLKCYEEDCPKCLTVKGYLDEYSRRCHHPDDNTSLKNLRSVDAALFGDKVIAAVLQKMT